MDALALALRASQAASAPRHRARLTSTDAYTARGAQLTDVEDLTNIRICIATVVDQEVGGKLLAAAVPAAPEANVAEVAALTEKEKVRDPIPPSHLHHLPTQPQCASGRCSWPRRGGMVVFQCGPVEDKRREEAAQHLDEWNTITPHG